MKFIACLLATITLTPAANAQLSGIEETMKALKSPPAETIKGLQQQRIELLEAVVKHERAMFEAGTIPYAFLAASYARLVQAKLAIASSSAERITYMEEHVANLQAIFTTKFDRAQYGMGHPSEALAAKADWLEAKTMLLREKQKAAEAEKESKQVGNVFCDPCRVIRH